jgi:hypothetical protein
MLAYAEFGKYPSRNGMGKRLGVRQPRSLFLNRLRFDIAAAEDGRTPRARSPLE